MITRRKCPKLLLKLGQSDEVFPVNIPHLAIEEVLEFIRYPMAVDFMLGWQFLNAGELFRVTIDVDQPRSMMTSGLLNFENHVPNIKETLPYTFRPKWAPVSSVTSGHTIMIDLLSNNKKVTFQTEVYLIDPDIIPQTHLIDITLGFDFVFGYLASVTPKAGKNGIDQLYFRRINGEYYCAPLRPRSVFSRIRPRIAQGLEEEFDR